MPNETTAQANYVIIILVMINLTTLKNIYIFLKSVCVYTVCTLNMLTNLILNKWIITKKIFI